MSEAAGSAALTAECHALCRYLVEGDAAPDVTAAYLRAHALGRVGRAYPTPADVAMLRLVLVGPGFARIVDAYAGVFARAGLLRCKLVLLIAILESRADTSKQLDSAVPGSRLSWALAVAAQGLAWAVRVVIGASAVAALRVWSPRGGAR